MLWKADLPQKLIPDAVEYMAPFMTSIWEAAMVMLELIFSG